MADSGLHTTPCGCPRCDLHRHKHTGEQNSPESLFIVAGDINEANLKQVIPKYHHHISCPTRGANILGHGYATIKDAYRSIPCPHFGKSDHSIVIPPASLQAEAEMGESFTMRSTVLVRGCGRPSLGVLGLNGLDHVQVFS
eukprot:g21209.t1